LVWHRGLGLFLSSCAAVYLQAARRCSLQIRDEKKLISRTQARMDDAELFDVFSIENDTEAPAPATATVASHLKEKTKKKKSKTDNKHKAKQIIKKEEHTNKQPPSPRGKRSHVEVIEISSDENVAGVAAPDDSPRPAKKPRKAEAHPVVVDSFETESDQIVRAAEGLQGVPVTDENIVIKKKVSKLLTGRF
jgi:hypothetical protein